MRALTIPTSPSVRAMISARLLRLLALGGVIAIIGCNGEPAGPQTGSLEVTVVGLPNHVNGVVLLKGPAGGTTVPSRNITGSGIITDLPAGSYTLTALPAKVFDSRFDPTPASQSLSIAKSETPVHVTVTYALATGSLELTVEGVPFGASTPLQVTGPQGYDVSLSSGLTLVALDPGTYSIAASEGLFAGNRYDPVELTQDVDVAATLTPSAATVHYVQTTGSLQLTITGVPCGESGIVHVSGLDGDQTVGSSAILPGLRPGVYTVSADPVDFLGKSYQPQPAKQQLVVATAATAQAVVTYAGSGGAVQNFVIDRAYIVQVVQRPDGTVPLVAGKAGLLRAFGASAEETTAAPPVRARFYRNGALVDTRTLAPPAATSQCTAEGELVTTWNEALAASFITTGLSVLLDVDPDNAFAESDESDNTWPASGQPAELNVRTSAPLEVRMVPIHQSENGLSGDVNAGNADQYVSFARKLFPIATIDVDVRATYSTSLPPLQGNDGNDGWIALLSELNTLRVADASSRHYYGVVKVGHTSGIAGIGTISGRTALGWDHLPSGSLVAAHELGHNLGRFHAPCGGAPNPDPNYPYAVGGIGVYGWDHEFNVLRGPTSSDLMGYCGFEWLSDYNYTGILEFREQGPSVAAVSRRTRPTLIVWGRRANGRLVLEPSFSAITAASLPTQHGPFRIEGRDANGRMLFSYAFAGERPDHSGDPDARHFAFAIPLNDAEQASLASIHLTDGTRSVVRRTAVSRVVLDASSATARERTRGADVTQLRWSPELPMAVVRDAVSGEIVALARDGNAPILARAGRALDVTLTDGVRSGASRRLQVQRQP